MTGRSHETTGGSRLLADPTDERSNCGVGVVMDLQGGGDHGVVRDALRQLENLQHRGATGAEENTGDGAGVMLRHPHEFFAAVTDADLGSPGEYAVGQLFFPRESDEHAALRDLVESTLAEDDLEVAEWREVPTDDESAGLGRTALESEPSVHQCFVRFDGSAEAFDRTLYHARRTVERRADADRFYVCSLDRRTVVYKGLLTAGQLRDYYPDLADERVASTFAMVHARFSTNTLGAWELAHPYRRTIHNGEINTIRGNRNWMRARERALSHPDLDVDRLTPITEDGLSDTASVDGVLELLMAGGRDLPHALRMLVPEAWHGRRSEISGQQTRSVCDSDERMDEGRRAWYDFHASLVEPWDGPALVAATDGERIAAVLDRNGLRPCRYDVTTEGRLYMSSEAGAIDLPADRIAERGRLEPGQLFLADPEEGRVVPDAEVFDDLIDDRYADWVDAEQIRADALGDATPAGPIADLRAHQRVHGYTRDELDELLEPMATDGKDPIGSMGDDTPLSVLSEFNRPLSSYFKQLFAQVSNPPLDYIREELVTSLETRLGRQHNLLDESPAHARQLVLDSPLLSDAETAAIKGIEANGVRAETIDLTYDGDEADLETAVERLRRDAERAIDAGYELLVLSDRATGEDRIPIPALLATGAVHHHLVRAGKRTRAGLVVESGDPRSVHDLAALIGYGAGAVNPYLAYRTVEEFADDAEGARAAYVGALEDGLLKVMAKMGISTVESYRGAQIFEAVGLASEFVAEYFDGTTARTEGIGIEGVEADLRERHEAAFGSDDLERQGEYAYRSTGRYHGWNPGNVRALQTAVREGDYGEYERFAAVTNDGNEHMSTLRGLLDFDEGRESVPLDEVEPASEIVTRFSTAAMSLGSLSPEAHENNAVAMNRLGARANTGEGGEPPERFGTERNCAIKQVASGRFGVTSEYLAAADDIQIKMAQGSKPGEGGQLPGSKVNETIAGVRCATPGVGLISPPPQHDIYSIEDLKQLIYDLRSANEDARIHVKLVSEAGIGTVAAGVSKANADCIHISGHSGGTGASPKTSIKHAGLPWELGLAEANQLLRETGLRSRVTLRVDGGLQTGRDVAIGALLGAEEFAFGTASLVTSGCVMARKCHENTCPVGIATQKEELRERFPGEPEHVINYMTFIAQDLREIMADLGFRTVDEMVGRADALRQRETEHGKARHLDLSSLLAVPERGERRKTRPQVHETDVHFDRRLLPRVAPAIEDGERVELREGVTNEDRAVGAMLSGHVSKARGGAGLPDDTITCRLDGSAGQSFGAFAASGVSLHLTGTANDYVGKGLSGGKLSISTPGNAAYAADGNVMIGNVALYGATGGEAYVEGVAGERFAVRNSGAKAVVEGVGDHGCEYMTGGVVAVLGETGKNFGAGMSGGVAYVLDSVAPEGQRDEDGETVGDGDFVDRCNTGMVTVESALDPADESILRRLVENHAEYTGSERARELLDDWEAALSRFVKVMPTAYRRVIEERSAEDVRSSPPPRAAAGAASAADGRAD